MSAHSVSRYFANIVQLCMTPHGSIVYVGVHNLLIYSTWVLHIPKIFCLHFKGIRFVSNLIDLKASRKSYYANVLWLGTDLLYNKDPIPILKSQKPVITEWHGVDVFRLVFC